MNMLPINVKSWQVFIISFCFSYKGQRLFKTLKFSQVSKMTELRYMPTRKLSFFIIFSFNLKHSFLTLQAQGIISSSSLIMYIFFSFLSLQKEIKKVRYKISYNQLVCGFHTYYNDCLRQNLIRHYLWLISTRRQVIFIRKFHSFSFFLPYLSWQSHVTWRKVTWICQKLSRL